MSYILQLLENEKKKIVALIASKIKGKTEIYTLPFYSKLNSQCFCSRT